MTDEPYDPAAQVGPANRAARFGAACIAAAMVALIAAHLVFGWPA